MADGVDVVEDDNMDAYSRTPTSNSSASDGELNETE